MSYVLSKDYDELMTLDRPKMEVELNIDNPFVYDMVEIWLEVRKFRFKDERKTIEKMKVVHSELSKWHDDREEFAAYLESLNVEERGGVPGGILASEVRRIRILKCSEFLLPQTT